MEEVQNQSQQFQETSMPQDSSTGVSFPTVGQPTKKSGGAKTLLILGILLLVGILGFIIFKNSSEEGETEELVPTSTFETSSTPTPVASPTGTPKAADKSKVKVEVQNGTGITGEAAYLQTQLKNLGYSNVTVGNASTQDATVTTVTYAKSLSTAISDEITAKLKELYKEVEVKTSSTATTDVVVVTGLKKGSTAKPSASATAKASASPSGSPKASGSASPSPTATP